MSQLSANCPGGHEHLPGSRRRDADESFSCATSAAAKYPKAMASKVVSIVLQSTQLSPASVPSSLSHVPLNARGSIAMQKQPRGKVVPQLVPEFKYIATIQTDSVPPLDGKRRLTVSLGAIPAGSKLLTPLSLGGKRKRESKNVDHEQGDQQVQDEFPSKGLSKTCQLSFGVFHSPREFIDKASLVVHPFDVFHTVPDCMLEVIFRNLTLGPGEIAMRRAQKLKDWLKVASKLAPLEKELHDSLEEGVAAVLKGKRILLLRHIAHDIKWQDMDVFDEMCQGFRIVGHQPASGIFALEPRPASISVEELDGVSKFVRPALLGKVKASPVDDDLKELFSITQEEALEKHWMKGPFTPDQIHALHGSAWLPVRRFGVRQSSGDAVKLRPIDDYAENRVNAAFAYFDKLDLRAMDQVVWAAVAITRMAPVRGEVFFRLSCGTELRAPLHPSLSRDGSWIPVISALDLSSAYKQLALHPSCRKYSIVSLKDPSTAKVCCFEGRVLPFGSTASVVHFNRVARLLQAIAWDLDLIVSNYFDDYPIVTPISLADSSMTCLVSLMDLLGFAYNERKLKAFGPCSSILGVEVDLSRADSFEVLVRNKQSRINEIVGSVNKVIQTGSMTFSECSRILGRIQYADSYIMGRAGRLAMATIRDVVKRHGSGAKLTA